MYDWLISFEFFSYCGIGLIAICRKQTIGGDAPVFSCISHDLRRFAQMGTKPTAIEEKKIHQVG